MKANTIDVVERLRHFAIGKIAPETAIEAADTIERLRAELAAKVPEGYVVVPVEPTEAMVEANNVADINEHALRDVWSAMIAAAEGGE